MKIKSPPNRFILPKRTTAHVLRFLCFSVFFGATAYAQVSFVHLTDPHIFDDNWQTQNPPVDEDNRLDNQAALTSCMSEIKEQMKHGEAYDFGVITGDLGIEYLVQQTRASAKDANEFEKLVAKKLEKAGTEFANLLALSRVKTWLFVPGNNDVLCEDPANIRYYHAFVAAVKTAFDDPNNKTLAKDLCPPDGSNYSQSDLIQIKGYAFIGFNDSSFKNSEPDKEEQKQCPQTNRITVNASLQKTYAVQVEDLLKNDNSKYAYVFYHIPEIDDPYLVTLKLDQEPLKTRIANKAAIGDSFYDSAWYVQRDVRDEWNKVVMNSKVRGLFAGHFHDNKRQSYLGFQWLRTPNYAPETLSKLHVSPPLALKLQYDKSERARGFEEVYIDTQGEVSTRVVWFNNGSWGLGGQLDEKEADSLRQITIADTYADNGRLAEAEVAYLKAAESTWPPTRQRAMEAAKQTVARRNSTLELYVIGPFRIASTTGLVTLWSTILALAAVGLAVLLLTGLFRWWGKLKGRNKLRIGAIEGYPRAALCTSLQQILMMIHGRMQAHFKKRVLVTGQPKLPLLVRSQGGEVADLMESLVPTGPAKLVAWLTKNLDRAQYSLGGSIQDRFRGTVIFLSLEEAGETLQTWQEIDPQRELLRNQIRLAFASLKYLIRRMNP